jgi:UDP-hydrolysing UDP-N-acetyl-D-glucosamine 2-epimerase
MSKKKILIITERRADYSRFKPILKIIKKEKFYDYVLVVTGSHLLRNHGYTIKEIKKDGFKVNHKIKSFSDNSKIDDGENMILGIGKIFMKISKVIKKEKPDLILSGFDIGANLALTIAGAHLNVPIAHIQGGELTGSIDESIRHAMSKFSNYHFVANYDAKNRLIKMGEKKNNIFNVGCPSLDALLAEKEINLGTICKKFGIDKKKKYIIVIQHPVTTENNSSRSQIIETIEAIKLSKVQTLFILPNNDSGHNEIIRHIKKSEIKWTKTLTIPEYKSLLKNCSLLLGNSSSGIHEAISFGVPVLNIGSRQNGRLKPKNVINAKHDRADIFKKINYCLENKVFINKIKNIKNPYGDGKSSKRIVNIIKKLDLKASTQKLNTY